MRWGGRTAPHCIRALRRQVAVIGRWPSTAAGCDGSAATEASDCVTSSRTPDDPEIHSVDQLASVCLGSLHVGHCCFKVLAFDPKTTVPPITAASDPIRIVGSN